MSDAVSGVSGAQPAVPEEWVRIVLPRDPAKTSGSTKTGNELTDNLKQYTLSGAPTTLLGIYLEHAKATVRLLGSALEVTLVKVLGSSTHGHLFTGFAVGFAVGIVVAGSLIAAAAIKAAIWTPFIILTPIVAGGTGLIGGSLGLLFGDEGATKDWAKTGWKIGEYLVGVPAVAVAGLTVLVRWIPLVITGIFSTMLDVMQRSKRTEHEGVISAASHQVYIDSFDLWFGGYNDLFSMTYNANSKNSPLVINLIRSGANPYSYNWARDSDGEGKFNMARFQFTESVAKILVQRGVLEAPPELLPERLTFEELTKMHEELTKMHVKLGELEKNYGTQSREYILLANSIITKNALYDSYLTVYKNENPIERPFATNPGALVEEGGPTDGGEPGQPGEAQHAQPSAPPLFTGSEVAAPSEEGQPGQHMFRPPATSVDAEGQPGSDEPGEPLT